MSLSDDASETSLSDVLEANIDSDIPMSALAYVPNAVSAPNPDITYLSTPPASPRTPSHFHDLSMLADIAAQVPKGHCVRRHARSSARYSAYSVPSPEQRQTFKRHSRQKKVMFVEDPHLPSVPPVKPTPVSPTADLVLASVHKEVQDTLVNPVEIHLSSQFSAQCNVVERECITDSVLTPTPTPHATQKSNLTIKIPGLVDRLALRLLGSCNVTGQSEGEEDVDGSSLDGYATSESSSEGDIDDDGDSTFRSSSASPDRSSRRKLRRRAATPYHRAGRESKRKELWVDADAGAGAGSDVPAFLLGPPTTGRPRTRVLRSGCVN